MLYFVDHSGALDADHIKELIRLTSLRWCLLESGLSFNPDRTHSVSVEIIGD